MQPQELLDRGITDVGLHGLIQTKIEILNMELKVKPAFGKDDRIVIHFNKFTGAKPERQYQDHIATHKFGARYAAKCFIESIQELCEGNVPNPTTKWLGPNTLQLNQWITIATDNQSIVGLEDIMEYEYKGDEKKWRLPHPYDQYASYIAFYHHGIHPQLNSRSREGDGLPELSPEERHRYGLDEGENNVADKRRRKKKPAPVEKEPRSKPTKKERKADPNVLTLAQLCKELKCDPKEARQALRKAKVDKPDAGWQWPAEQHDKISKVLSTAIDKLRKAKKK